MVESKSAIRKKIQALLRAQSPQRRHQKSDQIRQRLVQLERLKRADRVFCYVSLDDEVETGRLIDQLLTDCKRVAVPVVLKERGRKGELLASEIRDRLEELEPGPFGIWQPKPEWIRPVEPSQIEMAIIPGIAFDHQGHRLGHGKGYFDRFLRQFHPTCLKVGIGFDFQLVSRLPQEPHDLPMDLVVTNTETIYSANLGERTSRT